MAKSLIMTIQMNLMPNPVDLPSHSHFLAAILDSMSVFIMAFLGAACTHFLQLGHLYGKQLILNAILKCLPHVPNILEGTSNFYIRIFQDLYSMKRSLI